MGNNFTSGQIAWLNQRSNCSILSRFLLRHSTAFLAVAQLLKQLWKNTTGHKHAWRCNTSLKRLLYNRNTQLSTTLEFKLPHPSTWNFASLLESALFPKSSSLVAVRLLGQLGSSVKCMVCATFFLNFFFRRHSDQTILNLLLYLMAQTTQCRERMSF